MEGEKRVRAAKAKEAKTQQRIMLVCRVLLIVLGGGYIIAHLFTGLFGGFGGRMETVAATVTASVNYELYDAYIFRDENVITSGNTGYRYDILADGEMAGIGTEYARVYTDGQSDAADRKLRELDESIALLERCAVTLTSSGILSAKDTLGEGHMSIADALSAGEILKAMGHTVDLVEAYESLRINTGGSAAVKENLAEVNAAVAELKAERDELVASFGSDYESLRAGRTGYYYSGVDGYEAAFSTDGIGDKPLSEFFEAIDALSGKPSAVEGAVGRMVYDYRWYAALPVDMSVASLYIDDEGEPIISKFTVGFYDGGWQDIEMTLERVVQSPDDSRAILLFSSGVMNVGFEGGRARRVRIASEELTGYRVPTEAVRTDGNGESGVYVLKGGKVLWRHIEVIDDSEKDIYVLARIAPSEDDSREWLQQNDAIIVEGQDLYDGKTVYY
ncbi:MAG: hypothetical protein IJX46_09335 [Clostridia bacterium]|nr:hypothetical protein [Clostridia bacterium]